MALIGALGFYRLSKPASLSPEAQRLFREEENAIADGTFLIASLQLEKVVAQQPDHLLAAVRLAEAYYEQDQPSKAQQQLLKVSDRWVLRSADRHLREGTRRLLVRDFDGAIAELKKRAAEPGARLDLARMYQRASLLSEAEAEYRGVLP